jgi:uncharacterized protein YuzE
MKITYDAEVDALSITFRETTVTTRELGDGIAANFDADGNLAGIEILDAVERNGAASSNSISFRDSRNYEGDVVKGRVNDAWPWVRG